MTPHTSTARNVTSLLYLTSSPTSHPTSLYCRLTSNLLIPPHTYPRPPHLYTPQPHIPTPHFLTPLHYTIPYVLSHSLTLCSHSTTLATPTTSPLLHPRACVSLVGGDGEEHRAVSLPTVSFMRAGAGAGGVVPGWRASWQAVVSTYSRVLPPLLSPLSANKARKNSVPLTCDYWL